MEPIKKGDTVRLKSGGPLMTVSNIESDERIWCDWFGDKKQRHSECFDAHSLVKDEDRPVAPVMA